MVFGPWNLWRQPGVGQRLVLVFDRCDRDRNVRTRTGNDPARIRSRNVDLAQRNQRVRTDYERYVHGLGLLSAQVRAVRMRSIEPHACVSDGWREVPDIQQLPTSARIPVALPHPPGGDPSE